MSTLPRFIAGLTVSLLMAAGATAQALGDKETDFLKQAAQNGHAEVESSKLALQKAAGQDVKSFAQQMVDDHTKAGKELEALAKAKGVKVPTEPSIRQKAQLKLLSTKDGKEFDKSYADQMGVKAHQETVKLFEKGAADAKDPDVKAFATKTLPTLKHHLSMAEKLKASTASK
jgi:putative membrane protein